MSAHRYKLILWDEEEDRLEVLHKTSDAEIMAKLRNSILEFAGAPPRPSVVLPARKGPKGRMVCVVASEDDNGLPYKPGDSFENAAEASRALGFAYNAVSIALKQAEARNETMATLRGVSFAYGEDMGRVD